MVLDGRLAGPLPSLVFLAALAVWCAYAAARFGRVYRREHLRDSADSLLVGPRDAFSARKWTPEGLAFRRAYWRVALRAAVLLLMGWLALDWLF